MHETISVTSNNSTTETSWCVLDNSSTYEFTHFPHALQTLALCWSWFLTQPASNKRGLWFSMGGGGFGSYTEDWRAALAFKVMGCTELEYREEKDPPGGDPSYAPKRSDVVNHRFFVDRADALALRERLLREFGGGTKATWEGLHIGIVDRKKTRKLINIDGIESAIKVEYPSAVVERTTMENKTPLEQFLWWARQDVVVCGHGAAVSNMVFMRNNSAVIEIFPPHYYWLGFWRLGDAIGARNYGYFNGVDDPISDFGNNVHLRSKLRKVNLEPPIGDVIELLKRAVKDEATGDYRTQVDVNRLYHERWYRRMIGA